MAETTPTTTNEEVSTSAPKSATMTPHLVFFGSSRWDLLGRKTLPKSVIERGGSDAGEEFLGPTHFELCDHDDLRRPRAVFSGPCASHFVIVCESGRAFGIGRNDTAQLGCDDLLARHYPVLFQFEDTDTNDDDQVVTASCGRGHTLCVTKSGKVYAVGLNSSGQLGTGEVLQDTSKHPPYCAKWKRVKLPSSERVISVAAASDFSVFACESGLVYACGSGQYGQLGNGRTGERIETRNRVVFDTIGTPVRVFFPSSNSHNYTSTTTDKEKEDVKIKQVATGTNHTLALDQNGKVWSWGFGGYGRLGHKVTRNEMRPRMIELFDAPYFNLDLITCGATCSYAVQLSRKSTYFWGLTKKTGESNMYPKPLFDLHGNEMHALACGQSSTVAATDRSVVTWGPSPTVGELGYGNGNPKSSTKPKLVDAVDGLYCKSVAEGTGFTAIVVEVDTEEERKIFDKLDKRILTSGEQQQDENEDEAEPKKSAANKRKEKANSNGSASGTRGKNKKRKRAR